MDILNTIKPNSNQLNADDFISGPRNITITGVKGNSDPQQPVSISFQGDNNKPYKPCLSMRRVMVKAWGKDALKYVGRSMTLFCDPNVTFGKIKVGGIRISHMSHIENDFTIPLTVSKARRAVYPVRVLNVDVSTDEMPIEQQAEATAKKGLQAYTDFFTSLPNEQKKMLVDAGYHETFKEIAEAVE